MPLKIGIVGLPNAGKSTLFNALIKTKQAEAANFPFCTIDPNVGVVKVPDDRLQKLQSIVISNFQLANDKLPEIIPTTIEFIDIAGLVKNAHKGEGLGNQFLGHIRTVDAIALVARVFEDDNVIHVSGKVNPKEDMETILTELELADLEMEEKAKTKNKSADLAEFNYLAKKPLIIVGNCSEQQLKKSPQELGLPADALLISAKIEEELSELNDEEQKEYLAELGIKNSGLDRLIATAYKKLDLLTFFTAKPKEVRAWTCKRGVRAPEAAGKIHTDFEKGFIRAEIISYDDYVKYNGELGTKEAGKLRLEGQDYIIQDGDVVYFKFNI